MVPGNSTLPVVAHRWFRRVLGERRIAAPTSGKVRKRHCMLIFEGRLPSGAVRSHSSCSLLISCSILPHHQIAGDLVCHQSRGARREGLQDRHVFFGFHQRLTFGCELLAEGVALCLQGRQELEMQHDLRKLSSDLLRCATLLPASPHVRDPGWTAPRMRSTTTARGVPAPFKRRRVGHGV